ncbi:MAG: RNA methyltransferase [Planctomycetaceae bacterium]
MPTIRIDSLADSRLDLYRSLKKTNQTRRENTFIAEGTTVVERLLQSDFQVQSLLVTDQALCDLRSCIPEAVTVYQVDRSLATMLVGYTFHMGVLAAGVRRNTLDLSSVADCQGRGLIVFAERVIDPQNVGLLIRIASGFGADALVLTGGSADPFSRRAIRVSMGNGFFLPIVEMQDSVAALNAVRSKGYSSVATVLSDDAIDVAQLEFPEKTAMVLGNETHGVSGDVLQICDLKTRIPMQNGTDSLNVSIAAGIFCHEFRRQGSAGGSGS